MLDFLPGAGLVLQKCKILLGFFKKRSLFFLCVFFEKM